PVSRRADSNGASSRGLRSSRAASVLLTATRCVASPGGEAAPYARTDRPARPAAALASFQLPVRGVPRRQELVRGPRAELARIAQPRLELLRGEGRRDRHLDPETRARGLEHERHFLLAVDVEALDLRRPHDMRLLVAADRDRADLDRHVTRLVRSTP